MHGFRSFEMHLHGGERTAALRIDQESGPEVVAHIVGMRNLSNIVLARMRFVVQFAPVMREPHKRRIVLLIGLSTGVPQRLGKCREFHPRIVEKPPRCLRCRSRLSLPDQ